MNEDQNLNENIETPEQEIVEEVNQEQVNQEVVDTAPTEQPTEPVVSEEEKEKLQKQEFARKRIEERKQKLIANKTTTIPQEQVTEPTPHVAPQEPVQQVDPIYNQMREEYFFKAKKQELAGLEVEYKQGYPDYDDVVNSALELTKQTYISKGMDEATASNLVEKQKVDVADRAAYNGSHAAEAVYNEAKAINKAFEEYAKKQGYVKQGGETNLDKHRAISKPNAVTGGSGGGAVPDKEPDIANMTMGELQKYYASK
jgi:hypothetical protein